MRYKVFISAIAFSLLSTASYARIIDADMVKDIEGCLSRGNAATICEYPIDWLQSNEVLRIARNITWNTPATLQLISKEDVIFDKDAFIKSEGAGSLLLKAGMENERSRDSGIGQGKVLFKGTAPQAVSEANGKVMVYYNPEPNPDDMEYNHKYHNPSTLYYEKYIAVSRPENLKSYMLVNDVYDLQDIIMSLSQNYALSQDIDASTTQTWGMEGFEPLKAPNGEHGQPFSGDFDGNGYTVSTLYINRPNEDKVGLFGMAGKSRFKQMSIKNIVLKDFNILGNHYVGALAGWTTDSLISNVIVSGLSSVRGKEIVGGLIGTGSGTSLNDVSVNQVTVVKADTYKGLLFGTIDASFFEVRKLYYSSFLEHTRNFNDSIYYQSPLGAFTKLVTFCFQGEQNLCFKISDDCQ